MMEVSAKDKVVIILQCMSISNQHVVYFKFAQYYNVRYISLNWKKTKHESVSKKLK